MDMRILKAKTFHVSGKVVDPSGKAVAGGRGGGGGGMGGPGVMLTLSPADGEFLGFLGRNMAGVRDAGGEFEFPNVRPGTYILSADRRTGPNEPRSGARVVVTVGDKTNIDDLVVQMVAGSDVTGTVRQEGQATLTADNLRVMLQPQSGMRFGNMPGTVKDGTFKLDNMLPDKYTVTLTGARRTLI